MSDALREARSEDAASLLSRHWSLGSSEDASPRRFAPVPQGLMPVDRISILIGLLLTSDLTTVVVGAGASYASGYGTAAFLGEGATLALLGAVLLVNCLQAGRSYEVDALRSLPLQAGRILLSWSLVTVTLFAVLYFLTSKNTFPWAWFEGWFCLTLAMLWATRLVSARLIDAWRRCGRLSCRLAIVGGDEAVQKLARRISVVDDIELVTTLVLDRAGAFAPGIPGAPSRGLVEVAVPGRIPVTSTVDELLALARSHQIDEIIIAPGGAPGPALRHLIRALSTVAIDVKVHAIGLDEPISPSKASIQFGMPLYMVSERPLSGWARVVKRAEDIVISGVALLLLLPVLTIISLIIKLDSPGPVIFRQDRFGFNNHRIRIYKFRTMHHQREPERTVMQARRNDPRVTRVGRILRQTSLDELPQLLNVLKGDMSLVGPRPHPFSIDSEFALLIDGYLGRLRVKPGITGWAQVNGLRGETDTLDKMQRRVEHDLHYINNWSLLFDLKIILATTLVVFLRKNAY